MELILGVEMGGEPDGAVAGADSSQGGSSSDVVVVHVRSSNGNKFTVEVNLGATVLALKGLLVEKSEIPADHQRLIYKGRVLKDEQTLSSYGGCMNSGLIGLPRLLFKFLHWCSCFGLWSGVRFLS